MTRDWTHEKCIILLGLLLAFQMILGSVVSISSENTEHAYFIFHDDFEDGDATDWTLSPSVPDAKMSVVLEEDNYVMSERGHVWAEAGYHAWTNYTFEFRVKMIKGGPNINFRATGSRYFLHIHTSRLRLSKEDPVVAMCTTLKEETALFQRNTWYTIKIVCIGNWIRIHVDDILRLEYRDEDDPLLSGRIGLEGAPEAHILFDDVKVYTNHRLYISNLFWISEDAINEALKISADIEKAEQKLAEARAAFAKGDLELTESLVKESIDLALYSPTGPVSANTLSKYYAEYDQHLVEISGRIRDISYEQGVYNFAVDDGTGVVLASFNGTLGEIKSEDQVRIIGMFHASDKKVYVDIIEGFEAPDEEAEVVYTLLIYRDDFEDGDYSDWRTGVDPDVKDSGWKVVEEDGNHVLLGMGRCWGLVGDSEWTNYVFELKFKLIRGTAQVNFRMTSKSNAPDRYILRILYPYERLVLAKGGFYLGEERIDELEQVNMVINTDTWYYVKILCLGNNIRIYFNDALKFNYIDTDSPHLSGHIGLELIAYGGASSKIYLDDVKVSKIMATIDINDLIAYGESEIEEARKINADVSAAELKLEHAKNALTQEDHKIVQYLIDEAVWLAKRASLGEISIVDLRAMATQCSGHIVTVKGTIKSFRVLYGAGYEFKLYEGRGEVAVIYQKPLGDIEDEYEVKVTGVFDANTETVAASIVEKISEPLTPEEPATPTGFVWSLEHTTTLITVSGACVGALGWILRTRSNRRRKQVLMKKLIAEIDDIYTRFKMNARRCEGELQRLKGEVLDVFKEGIIDEENYNTLTTRIGSYMKEVREQIGKEKP